MKAVRPNLEKESLSWPLTRGYETYPSDTEQEQTKELDTRPLEYLKRRVYHALDWDLTKMRAHVDRLAKTANECENPWMKQAHCTNYITGLVQLYDMFAARDRWQEAQNIQLMLDHYGVDLVNNGETTYWKLRLGGPTQDWIIVEETVKALRGE